MICWAVFSASTLGIKKSFPLGMMQNWGENLQCPKILINSLKTFDLQRKKNRMGQEIFCNNHFSFSESSVDFHCKTDFFHLIAFGYRSSNFMEESIFRFGFFVPFYPSTQHPIHEKIFITYSFYTIYDDERFCSADQSACRRHLD